MNLETGNSIKALVERLLDKHSAVDVFTIDLSGKSSFADFMIVASGTSQRHVCALAEHIRSELSIQGLKGITIEGLEQGDWVLLDLGDVIVHLFRPEVRSFYNLEKMWSMDHFPDKQPSGQAPKSGESFSKKEIVAAPAT